MAFGGEITMIKEPTGVYPVYNDSFITFEYEYASERSEITVYPTATFPNIFTLYPDSDGQYRFNLKELAKVILNEGGFKDVNIYDSDNFDLDRDDTFSNLLTNLRINIAIFSSAGGDGDDNFYYDFFKSLKQIGENVFSNPYQLLSYSIDGISYNLQYFEGFPFHIDLQKPTSGVEIKILNKNNEGEIFSKEVPSDSYRFNIDVVEHNWTLDNLISLNTGLNVLEVSSAGDFKTNINLTKKKIAKGVYLKWFNSDGGYSFHLFEEFFKDELKAKDIDIIDNNEFLNVGEITGESVSVGKTASRKYKVKTRVNQEHTKVFESLFTSPYIQMYSSKCAFIKGQFIDVTIKATYKNANKRRSNEYSLDINLPEIVTAKL